MLTLRPGERQVEVAATDPTLATGSARCTVTGNGRSGARVLVESDYRIRNPLVRILFGRKLLLLVMGRIMDRVQLRAEALAGR